MKTTMKQLAAGTFIALLLLVGNVKAEGTEVINASNKNIETTLALENWMTDETIWNTNTIEMANFVIESEMNLNIEDWMTNAETWSFSNNFITENEEALELEDWMLDRETWHARNITSEPELTIENWMINDKLWE